MNDSHLQLMDIASRDGQIRVGDSLYRTCMELVRMGLLVRVDFYLYKFPKNMAWVWTNR